MSIIKNKIPILEFDTEQTAVISPVHENLNPGASGEMCVCFLGEYIEDSWRRRCSDCISIYQYNQKVSYLYHNI